MKRGFWKQSSLLRWVTVVQIWVTSSGVHHAAGSPLSPTVARLPPRIANVSSVFAQSTFFPYDAFPLASTESHILSCVDQSRFSW